MREYLKNVTIFYKGDYKKIHRHVELRKPIQNAFTSEKFITICDDIYPKCLFHLQYPPYVLFYCGNINLLNTEMVSVVGSRNPSDYGRKATQSIVEVLKNKYTLVSGLAKGIDALVHQIALSNNTIAIIANGLDISYPKENTCLQQELSNNHLILTEYPKGVAPQKHYFHSRNRIIAALGSKLFVLGAKEKSGTMITVNCALEINREVVVLPYPIDDDTGKGCNLLIEQGASILTNLNEIDKI